MDQWHVYQTPVRDDRGDPTFIVLAYPNVPGFQRVATCSSLAGACAQKDALKRISQEAAGASMVSFN